MYPWWGSSFVEKDSKQRDGFWRGRRFKVTVENGEGWRIDEDWDEGRCLGCLETKLTKAAGR
jgi:hypothetical protein